MAPPALQLCAIQGNEGFKFCHLATLLIGLAFVGCDSTLAVISLCAALALSAGKYAGTTQGYMQLAHGRASHVPGWADTLVRGIVAYIVNGSWV